MTTRYSVAWWNVENLFDKEKAPGRSEKLQRAIGKSLKDWTAARRDRKIAQLASIIAQLDGGRGPDLLGICEVENEAVVTTLRDAVEARLPGRSYSVVHADMSDRRGIDIAFLDEDTLLEAPPTRSSSTASCAARPPATSSR